MKESKIAKMGMINMLSEIKNPLTNIRLCIELLESGDHTNDTKGYYAIIKNNALKIETSIRDIYATFKEHGFALYLPGDEPGGERKLSL
ncbi:MAG: hypothetical protein ABJA37_02500 [Ferruginibacter sp.]